LKRPCEGHPHRRGCLPQRAVQPLIWLRLPWRRRFPTGGDVWTAAPQSVAETRWWLVPPAQHGRALPLLTWVDTLPPERAHHGHAARSGVRRTSACRGRRTGRPPHAHVQRYHRRHQQQWQHYRLHHRHLSRPTGPLGAPRWMLQAKLQPAMSSQQTEHEASATDGASHRRASLQPTPAQLSHPWR